MLYLDIIAVFIYGIIISCIILVAVFKSRTSPLYHALARVSDKAKSKTYVILPLISTALGGTISVLLFGKFSIIGFFVAGWGDGMAELAGKAWGRHKYRVPTWGKKKRYKSVEGTITIFLVGAAAVFTAMILMDIPWEIIFRVVILCSALSALIEAFSPPGTDNFTVQIIASAVAFLLFQSKI